MPSEEMMILISAREAAMSEKTITRYFPNRNYAFMEDHPNGAYVQFHDHEAALAAKDARIAELERSLELVTKERDHIQFKLQGAQEELHQAVESWQDFQRGYSSLRAAIEAKAREADRNGRWICNKCGYIAAEVEIANPKYGPTHEGCNYHAAWGATIHAAELRALLGTKS